MAQTIYRLQSVVRAQAVMAGLKHHGRQSRYENAGLSVFSHHKSFVIIFCTAIYISNFFFLILHIIHA